MMFCRVLCFLPWLICALRVMKCLFYSVGYYLRCSATSGAWCMTQLVFYQVHHCYYVTMFWCFVLVLLSSTNVSNVSDCSRVVRCILSVEIMHVCVRKRVWCVWVLCSILHPDMLIFALKSVFFT